MNLIFMLMVKIMIFSHSHSLRVRANRFSNPLKHRMALLSQTTDTSTSKANDYWINEINKINNEYMSKLIKQLNFKINALGYQLNDGGQRGTTLFSQIESEKRKHPTKVILTRCGDFYEAYGIDALMLIYHCKLKPMAGKLKAGCPYNNIQNTLNDLTAAGLTVAVYEEVKGITSATGELKKRIQSQIVSPGSSTYIYDMTLKSSDIEYPHNPPVISIYKSSNGLSMSFISLDEKTITFYERLTEEASRVLIQSNGCFQPLYISCPLTELNHHLCTYQYVKIEGYSDRNFHSIALSRVCSELNLVEGDFRYIPQFTNNRPAPICLSTALQIGLYKNDHVPDLIPFLLPKKYNKQSYYYLRKLLLCPPPVHIADHFHQLCQELSELNAGLPHYVSMPFGKIMSLLSRKQGNPALLRDLAVNLRCFLTMTNTLTSDIDTDENNRNHNHLENGRSNKGSEEESPFSKLIPLLEALTSADSGLPMQLQSTILDCQRMFNNIQTIIPIPSIATITTEFYDNSQSYNNFDNYNDVDSTDTFSTDKYQNIPARFFEENEKDFRNLLSPTNQIVATLYSTINSKKDNLISIVQMEFKNAGKIDYEIINNSIYLIKSDPKKGVRTKKSGFSETATTETAKTTTAATTTTAAPAAAAATSSTVKFVEAKDRYNKIIPKKFTTENVMRAVGEYIAACELTTETIRGLLEDLSAELYASILSIQQVTLWVTILEAAQSHTVAAIQKGWNLPTMVDFLKSSSSSSNIDSDEVTLSPSSTAHQHNQHPNPALAFRGLIPYWIDRHSAVENAFNFSGVILLTAPNMAGKSTVMRSTLVAALLGNCGLFVPAMEASIPRFQKFFMRTSSYDIPSEGISAFALEMDDVRVMLSDCQQGQALVMLDEVGKGTSTKDGTVIACALLEYLSARRIHSIFSTHLHEILDMPLALSDCRRMTIHVEETSEDSLQPTFKLVDGECRDSKAILTAQSRGIPSGIISRAKELNAIFDKYVYRYEGSSGGDTHNSDKVSNCDNFLDGLTNWNNIGRTDEEIINSRNSKNNSNNNNAIGNNNSNSNYDGSNSYTGNTVENSLISDDISTTTTDTEMINDSDRNNNNNISCDNNEDMTSLDSFTNDSFPALLTTTTTTTTTKDISSSNTHLTNNLPTTSPPPTPTAITTTAIQQISSLLNSHTLNECVQIGVRDTPPAKLERTSCVYILIERKIKKFGEKRLPDSLYVGETVSISRRLDQHRKSRKGVDLLMIASPVSNKSKATRIETLMIRRLKQLGFDVRDATDESHALFGESS